MILAHGIGGRSDLPVPLWLALYAGVAAVLAAFFAMTALRNAPTLRGRRAGRPLPTTLQRVADAPATRAVLRLAGLVLLTGELATAWFGADDAADNPAPAWFYVWFWVGLVPLSLLAGPVWRLLNPVRTLAAALRVLPPLRSGGAWTRQLPARVGYLPAIAGLFAFLWLELVFEHSESPRAVAVFVSAYVLVHALAGAVYGPRWFDRGDAFEVYSRMISALSPLGRRHDGRLVLRSPLNGLLTVDRSPGATTFVLVVLGSTVFDGLTRWSWWRDLTSELDGLASMLLGTAGLAAAVALVALTYRDGIRLTRPYVRSSAAGRQADPYAAFVHPLIPIMVAYSGAHYFSLAVFEGQQGWLLASDPFGRGWDLLGTAGLAVDYTAVSTGVIATVQVVGIVLGHVAAVVSTHFQAVALLRPEDLKVGQYPLLTLMIGYTVAGIALISAT